MLKIALLSLVIVAASMVFLCIAILLKRNGRFPKTHVSSSKAMRERGVTCALSQDFAARHRRAGVRERVPKAAQTSPASSTSK